ncbi:hypothetical protein CHN51_08225 [Sphingorhabdus sp. YGSMI21]|nr:hypothetical protein CHN51_08225 [Sphingorhabdus sp. YGSMI21]
MTKAGGKALSSPDFAGATASAGRWPAIEWRYGNIGRRLSSGPMGFAFPARRVAGFGGSGIEARCTGFDPRNLR